MSAAPLARATDPVTSDLAAEGVDLAGSQARVLHLLTENGPLADFELVEKDGGTFTPQRLRTARHELQVAGDVESVDRIPVKRGSRTTQHTVWGLTA